MLTDSEHRFLHGFTLELNGVIRSAASDAGFFVADDVERSLLDAGRALCGSSDDLGVNWIQLNSVQGALTESSNPRNWFHNSLHPNPMGHTTIADALNTWLDRCGIGVGGRTDLIEPIDDAACRPGAIPSESSPLPRVEVVSSDGLPGSCTSTDPEISKSCETDWLLRQLRAMSLGPSLALLALVAIVWAVSVVAIALRRRLVEVSAARHPVLEPEVGPTWEDGLELRADRSIG